MSMTSYNDDMPALSSVLNTQDLAVGYRSGGKEVSIIKNVSLNIEKGSLTGLVGINGSGKSTLLRTLSGLQDKLEGRIYLSREDMDRISAENRSRKLSVVLTGQYISKNLTVGELVALGRQPYTNWLGKLTEPDKEIIRKSLAATELEELKYRKCYSLSDGQLQRALIARALAQDTELILLDEPTTHLDLHHKASVLSLLRTICRETGKTILFSTHDIELILSLCDQIIVLHEGKAVMENPDELIKQGIFEVLFPKKIIGFDRDSRSFFIKK